MTTFSTDPEQVRARLGSAGWTAEWFKDRGLMIGGRDPGLLRGAARRDGLEGLFEIVPSCEDGDLVDRNCTRGNVAQASQRLETSKAWAWVLDHERERAELESVTGLETIAAVAARLRERGWTIDAANVTEDHEDGVWQIRGVQGDDRLRYELLLRQGTPTITIHSTKAAQALLAALGG